MLANILRHQGLFLGHRTDHHGEALFFLGLNRWILRACDADWDQPALCIASMRHPERVIGLAQELRQHLSGWRTWRYLGHRTLSSGWRIGCNLRFAWGFKDPRTAITLPVWLQLFPNAKIIRIRRHGLDVAASLQTRFFAPMPDERLSATRARATAGKVADLGAALDLWAAYERATDEWLREVPPAQTMTISFEQFVRHPELDISRLTTFAGIPLRSLPVALRPDHQRAYAYRHNPELLEQARKSERLLREHGYDI